MKLLYDHQIFSSFPRSGISRYFCELFQEFDALEESWECTAHFSNNEFLQALRPLPRFFPHREFRGRNRLLEAVNLFYTHQRLKRGNFDLFHSTYSKPYDRKRLGGRPYVITVHDMTHEKFPELPTAARESAEEALSIARADAIICPSHATAANLAALYPEAAEKITVIYHGVRLVQEELAPPLAGNYLLYVGTRKFYRDFAVAARAAAEFPECQLLCVGGGAFDGAEKALFRELHMTERVRQRFLSEAGLAAAYRHAAALLFPSRAEGFGLPVIEAAARGCVPILSDIPIFREIGGAGALYFPVGDAEKCAERISAVLHEPEQTASVRQKALAGIARFDWQESARQHLKLYRSLLN